eukprot:CAMPEP_0115837084 /NCGR_PEP_ID=MMETSP0287-20121206/5039_1 /TAXON_ID=412157 /ORGANISM="Chrysochromulina rotalis, Strain UIO044" /LENGTH=311 /DNA_ID=CAMNT_0003290585 /DNA_START=17 /DNA_END=952 /DNA_ORIENTATION=+
MADNPKGTTYSTFGQQSLGGKASAPSFGFGSNSRDKQNNVFISQEHMAIQCAGKNSPGPAMYTQPQSVGPQPNSRYRRAPTPGFGTAERFRKRPDAMKTDGRFGNNPGPGAYASPPASVGPQVLGRFKSEPLRGFGTAERKHVKKVWISQSHMKTDMHGMHSPGPATYALKSTMGKQDESVIPSPPTWVFSSAARTEVEPGKHSPGPAAYTLQQSVGPQLDSRKPSAGTPGFGASTRDIRAKIYIGEAQGKSDFGKQSPGPAAPYQLVQSVGKQVLSQTREAPAAAFSKHSRWADYEREQRKNAVPGPGAY